MRIFICILLAIVISACSSNSPQIKADTDPNSKINRLLVQYNGKNADTHYVCEKSDFPSCTDGIHKEDVGGKIVDSNGKIISFAEVTGGYVYALVKLADGREFYKYFPTLSDEDKARLNAEETLRKKPIPRIGMSTLEADDTCWGEPEHVNTTLITGHTFEQWVYPNGWGYLYFDDGKLTSIQVSGPICGYLRRSY